MTENCCSPQPLSSPTPSPHLGERRGGLEPLRPLSERRQRPRAVAAAPSRTRPAKLCRCPRPSNPATPASCHRCCQGLLATDTEGRRRMGGVPATARRHCDCANWWRHTSRRRRAIQAPPKNLRRPTPFLFSPSLPQTFPG